MFPKNVSNYHYKTLHAIMRYESLNGKVVEIHFIPKTRYKKFLFPF